MTVALTHVTDTTLAVRIRPNRIVIAAHLLMSEENLPEPVLADGDTVHRDDFCLRLGCIRCSWGLGVYGVRQKPARTPNHQHKALLTVRGYGYVCMYIINQELYVLAYIHPRIIRLSA